MTVEEEMLATATPPTSPSGDSPAVIYSFLLGHHHYQLSYLHYSTQRVSITFQSETWNSEWLDAAQTRVNKGDRA